MATSTDSLVTHTAVDHSRRRDDIRLVPAVLIVGSAENGAPDGPDRVITFERNLAIGRRAKEDLEADAHWVVRDHLVSRLHCRISKGEEGWEIADLGSRNGTAVDGQLLKAAPLRLKDGAVIFLGGHVAVFRLIPENELDAIRGEVSAPLGPVPTASPAFAAICHKLKKLARSPGEILLTGETGVGKEVYARAIHQLSGRTGQFMAINCAALPRELMESELFGFVRGAHSEAKSDKKGLIEEAHGGTLFLDEIGDMPQDLQVKLLRFLQEREYIALGSTKARKADVRVLAATSRSAAPTAAETAGLRQDLSARLGAEPIRLPPLRQRIEDIGALTEFVLKDRPWRFESIAFQALCLYNWPGNVRELAKVIETAEVLAQDSDLVRIEHLPSGIAKLPERAKYTPHGFANRPPPSAAELEQLLRRFEGNVSRVAREIDRKPALIYRWCHRYKLDPEHFRAKD